MRWWRLLPVAGCALALGFPACGRDDAVASDDGTVGDGDGGGSGRSDAGTDAPVLSIEDTGPSIEPVDRDASCADAVVKGDLKPASMLFVVDRSGSMNCNLPEDGQTTAECELTAVAKDSTQPTKWALTEAALSTALGQLAKSGNINAGLLMFPAAGASKCTVATTPDQPVSPLDATHLGTLTSFLDTITPKGATPLAEAVLVGYQHLYGKLQAGTEVKNQFVVLLTDGRPSTTDCPSDALARLLDGGKAEAAVGINIRTFVIGVPGSEDGRSILSELAFLGGTARSETCDHGSTSDNVGDCHMDLTQSSDFAADLEARLNEIRGRVSTCAFNLPTVEDGEEIDPNRINILVNDEIISPDSSKDCLSGANGWQYSKDGSEILLCGEACDKAQAKDAEVEILLGCTTQVT